MRTALLLAAAVVAAAAQQSPTVPEVRVSAVSYAPATTTLRVETNLIEVGVVVRESNGRVISGLQKSDFYILDKGARREISSFAIATAPAAPADLAKPPVAPVVVESPSTPAATAPRRFIAIHFDDYSTNVANLRQAQTAADKFISEGLGGDDVAAIFTSSGQLVLDFTSDKAKLTEAVGKIRPHPRFSDAGLMKCPRISPYQAYLISVEDDPSSLHSAQDETAACQSNTPSAVTNRPQNRAIDAGTQMIRGQAEQTWAQARIVSQDTLAALGGTLNTLAGKQGNRLLLFVSSGFISATLESERERLVNAALRAGIVINSLDAKGLEAEGPGRAFNDPAGLSVVPISTYQFETSSQGDKINLANQAMGDFAQSTGGLFFHSNNDLAGGFRLLGSRPDVTYLLGFNLGEGDADGTYHKLKVSLNTPKNYVLSARPGYFASKPAPRAPDPKQQLDSEVASSSTLQQFPATLTYQLMGSSTIKVQVHVDITALRFPLRDDRHLQQLKVVAALMDDKGNLVTGKEGTMALALTDATFARLSASGIDARLNLQAPPGRYRLRAVAQEQADGKMASATLAVELK